MPKSKQRKKTKRHRPKANESKPSNQSIKDNLGWRDSHQPKPRSHVSDHRGKQNSRWERQR